MTLLSIEEWSQVLENTAIGNENITIDELIGSLLILKGKEFYKDE